MLCPKICTFATFKTKKYVSYMCLSQTESVELCIIHPFGIQKRWILFLNNTSLWLAVINLPFVLTANVQQLWSEARANKKKKELISGISKFLSSSLHYYTPPFVKKISFFVKIDRKLAQREKEKEKEKERGIIYRLIP